MFDLSGMTALVTGASGGIGSAIARALAAQGARLALSGSNPAKLRSFREELNADYGHDHVEITCDLSNTAQVEELVPATLDTLGQLDILVNNAGITRDNLAMRMKDEEWSDVIRINLEAAFRLMRAASKPMMKARFGRIVTYHFGGRRDRQPRAGELRRRQGRPCRHVEEPRQPNSPAAAITVNCVAPGFIRTAMTDVLPEAQKEALNARIPMGRMGEGGDIGAAVAFLASKEAGLHHRPDAACERRHGDDFVKLGSRSPACCWPAPALATPAAGAIAGAARLRGRQPRFLLPRYGRRRVRIRGGLGRE